MKLFGFNKEKPTNPELTPEGEEKETEAFNLFEQALREHDENRFQETVTTLQKVLLMTNDPLLKADAHNNTGYALLRLGEYEKSIPEFKKALEFDPNYGFAKDNLGYALIKTNQLEEGKAWVDRALQTDNNDHAYSYRNLALYYWSQTNIDLAHQNFKKAFDLKTPVDLLEFHYAEFLFSQGYRDQGIHFLKMAVEKNEPEAIAKMKEVNL